MTRPAGRTRGSRPGADEIVQEPGPRMLAAALGLGDGHGGFRAYRLQVAARPRGISPNLPAVTQSSRSAFRWLPACRSWKKAFLLGRIRQGPPCMRWGALPGLATPGPASCLAFAGAARRPPVPGARARDRSPGSSHAPGSPQVVPVSNGESIFTASANTAQEPEVNYFGFFRYPHGIHKRQAVIRAWRWLSTGLFTARPQVTWCNPGNTGSRRRRV